MALNQKGGVRTQKVKVALGITALFLLGAMFCVMAVGDDSSAATFDAEADVTFCKTSSSVDMSFTGDNNYYVVSEIIGGDGKVEASKTVTLYSSATMGYKGSLTLTAPENSGNYTIKNTFYKDSNKETLIGEKSLPLKVVDPITLKVTLQNTSSNDVKMTVYFVINGQKVDDSVQTITVSAAESDGTPMTKEVTYDYIVKDVGDTRYCLQTDDQYVASQVSGFGVEKMFYAHDDDHTLVTALVVIAVILLLVLIVYVYRKPVVNKGKPKGRR